jgi:hypothetical protein
MAIYKASVLLTMNFNICVEGADVDSVHNMAGQVPGRLSPELIAVRVFDIVTNYEKITLGRKKSLRV